VTSLWPSARGEVTVVPPLRLAPVPNVVVDVAAWALFHAATGYAVHRLPLVRLQRDNWLLRPRHFEHDGRLYERFRIRRWKDTLPEAGALFPGGMSKRHIIHSDACGLRRFAAEPRRAELGHWSAAACGPVFVLWNPPVVAAVMIAYGVLINAPFIAIQRYNRLRIGRVLARRNGSSSPSDVT
jgi:glycosyl-4,4'-diaponeurosporenoate acyltransferase